MKGEVTVLVPYSENPGTRFSSRNKKICYNDKLSIPANSF
jgi:hypothetical protein